MTVLDRNPSSVNFLSVSGFKLVLKRAPNLTFMVQQCAIPSLTVGPTISDNPLVKVPYNGDHIDYAPFSCMFKLQDNLADYLEIFEWIKGLGYPESNLQYKKLSDAGPLTGRGLKSDISLFVLNNSNISVFEIKFIEAFPIDLGEIQFETTNSDIRYATCQVTFAYAYFKIDSLVACP